MIDVTEKSKCSGCAMCKNLCPVEAIYMKADEEGFLYPEVEMQKCINCGACEKICPILNKKSLNCSLQAYGCINRNDTVRANSSSGGIFYLLGEYVISQNGVVFGAKFDDEFRVVHDFAENIEKMRAFQGSKYLQSDIGDTYKTAKKFLEQNRLVLFSGTPCEIEGLRAFLQKDYKNLICQDIICHGAPSPMIWKKYVEYHETKMGTKVENVNFRCKKYGWSRNALLWLFSNSKAKTIQAYDDLYMRSFSQNLTLRPSCYACSFKGCERSADITLGDFWGVEHLYPDLFDDQGTSLVIVNSAKGENILNEIKNKIIFKQVDLEKSISFNSSYSKSVSMPDNRDAFMKEIFVNSFDKVIKECCKVSISTKIKRKIKRLLKR